jgi:cysteine-rich repeat protein
VIFEGYPSINSSQILRLLVMLSPSNKSLIESFNVQTSGIDNFVPSNRGLNLAHENKWLHVLLQFENIVSFKAFGVCLFRFYLNQMVLHNDTQVRSTNFCWSHGNLGWYFDIGNSETLNLTADYAFRGHIRRIYFVDSAHLHYDVPTCNILLGYYGFYNESYVLQNIGRCWRCPTPSELLSTLPCSSCTMLLYPEPDLNHCAFCHPDCSFCSSRKNCTACLTSTYKLYDTQLTPMTYVCTPCNTSNQILNGSTCFEKVCGDGVVVTGELCDDGNMVSGDGCSSDCLTLEIGFNCSVSYFTFGSPKSCLRCINGCHECPRTTITQCTECLANYVLNNSVCVLRDCGNSIVEETEQCDDGNTDDLDGCDSSYFLEQGFACQTILNKSYCMPCIIGCDICLSSNLTSCQVCSMRN